MKIHTFGIFILIILTSNSAYAKNITCICEGGSIKGARVQHTTVKGIEITEDRVTQPEIIYHIDTENKKYVRVTYGNKSRPASILTIQDSFITITYVFNGYSYMDTLFTNGLVFSSEHKYMGAKVATTWHYICRFTK